MSARLFLILGSGVVATAVGMAFLLRPNAGWIYGAVHKSDAAPVIGVGFLVWPVVLLVIAVRRFWDRVMLEREARAEKRHRK